MRILGINSSPRSNGNTRAFLTEVLKRSEELGAETEYVWLGDKSIKGCRGCYRCIEKKCCAVEDDFQPVFEAMMRADVILLGSPVYHASMTSDMKALLDRAGFSGRWAKNEMKAKGDSYDWGGCVFSGKIVAPIAIARRTGQTLALAEMIMWAAANDCIIMGNTYWNMGVAGKGGAVNPEDDPEGIGIMKGLAERLVYTAEKLNK